jgi:hypothetical protein
MLVDGSSTAELMRAPESSLRKVKKEERELFDVGIETIAEGLFPPNG